MAEIQISRDLKRKVISGIVVLLIIVSTAELYLGSVFSLPEEWYVPVIFVSLILIIELISDLYEIERKVDLVVEQAGYSKVDMYDNYADYFRALSSGLKSANSSVHLTHIRHQSPDDFNANEVSDWFEEVQSWCNRNPSAPVRRITTLSNDAMIEWGELLQSYTKENKNFHVKAIDWEFVFPMVNIVIFDKEQVFLTLTSDTAEQTRGVRIRDSDLADAYIDYFNYMWRYLTDLDEKLEELKSESEEATDISDSSN